MIVALPGLFSYLFFIYDLFVARTDSWISYKTSTWTELIYAFFTTRKAEGEGWDPVKLG